MYDPTEDMKPLIGKVFSLIKVEDDTLIMWFADGSKASMSDTGQTCCEYRHMCCDDDLIYFLGSTFLGVEQRDHEEEAEYEVHDVSFLIVNTSKGSFTVANHNEHNGYYGGFCLVTAISLKNTA